MAIIAALAVVLAITGVWIQIYGPRMKRKRLLEQKPITQKSQAQILTRDFELKRILIAAVIGFALGWALIGSPFWGLYGAIAAAVITEISRRMSGRTRRYELEEQLEQALFRGADVLRGGAGPLQMLEELSGERTPQPVRTLFETALTEARTLGLAPIEAIRRLADRVEIQALTLYVAALDEANARGADLAEVTQMHAQNMRKKLMSEARLRSVTSQSRYTAIVMLLIGIGVTGIMHLIGVISHNPMGETGGFATQALSAAMYTMMGIGYLVTLLIA